MDKNFFEATETLLKNSWTGMPYKRKSVAHQKASIPLTHPHGGGSQARTLSNMASQTEDADPAIQEQDNFTALMQAINTCQTTLTRKIGTIQLEMGLIRKGMDKLQTRLTEVEHHVGDAEDRLRDHSPSLHTLTTKVSGAGISSQRRNNLRIIWLPEGSEDPNLVTYIERLLRQLFPQAAFSPFFAAEQAHRMLSARGPPGAPPHMLIICLLNFRDRDLVLRESRKIEALKFEGTRL